VNAFFDQLRVFGAGRLTAIFGLAVGVAAALVYFSGAVGGGAQSLLYSGLDPAEAAATSQLLDENSISHEIGDGGTAIYVASDQVDEARVRVAAGGPLGGASVGYEIFDRTDSFGQTSFVQNINAKRALEGELARTIQSLAIVNSARVHLNIPERRMFRRDQQHPTAAITISARGSLTTEQIRVIRNIVASGAGLEPNRISLSDDRGRQLASATETEMAGGAVIDERRTAIEVDMRQKILNVVEGMVGAGAARVQVSAEIDRQSVTQSSEEFDPEGSVLMSRNRSEDTSEDQNGSSRNQVSASENLPGAEDNVGSNTSGGSRTENSTDSVSYAVSSTTRTEIIEAGALRRLSVAVAVDGILETLDDGTVQWSERSAEDLQRIEDLVRSTMGFIDEPGVRQDDITVRQFEFARTDPLMGSPATGGFSFGKNDIMRVAEIIVLFVTALLVIFLVARPLVKGASGIAPVPQGLALAGAGGLGTPQLSAAEAPAALPASNAASPVSLPSSGDTHAGGSIDIAKIDGQVKASSVKKVAGIVDQHPEESISILRTWLHEG
jgi:flagellar M-ring protein FliF